MSKVLRIISLLSLLFGLVSVSSSQQCAILTAADVQKITGTPVKNVPWQSQPGAGGRCANFATSDGKLYLGVSETTNYKSEVAAVPESVYPKRETLTGVGDEGILMKDGTGHIRYLVARKGNRGVILFPFHSSPTDEQLKKLAIAALSH